LYRGDDTTQKVRDFKHVSSCMSEIDLLLSTRAGI